MAALILGLGVQVEGTYNDKNQLVAAREAYGLSQGVLVEPGSKVKLDKIDPGYTGRHVSEQKANDDIEKYRAKLTQQQLLMYAEKRHSLLIVLQAQEGSGTNRLLCVRFG
jgi:hypothetical protein